MNHRTGYKVTIIDTEQVTLTRTVKREIKIEPLQRRTEKKTRQRCPPLSCMLRSGKTQELM